MISTPDFIDDFTEHCKNASKRIYITVTIIRDDDGTQDLFDALETAAKRGIDVNLTADAFTYTELKTSYKPSTPHTQSTLDAKLLERRMKKAGAKFRWLGRLNWFAFFGRTHIKWFIVDDTVYSFGGVNLDAESQDYVDFHLRTTNKLLADRLCDEQQRIVRADQLGRSLRSRRFGDDDNTVLLDSGYAFDSVIYRRACYLAAQSSRIVLVSQYCPTGKLSRLIKKTDSDLYFNHWTGAGFLNKWTIRVGMWLSRQHTSYHKREYLHAKFIIFTLKSGEKVAITGSHNFVWAGSMLGTREVALESKNSEIIDLLEKFIATRVA